MVGEKWSCSSKVHPLVHGFCLRQSQIDQQIGSCLHSSSRRTPPPLGVAHFPSLFPSLGFSHRQPSPRPLSAQRALGSDPATAVEAMQRHQEGLLRVPDEEDEFMRLSPSCAAKLREKEEAVCMAFIHAIRCCCRSAAVVDRLTNRSSTTSTSSNSVRPPAHREIRVSPPFSLSPAALRLDGHPTLSVRLKRPPLGSGTATAHSRRSHGSYGNAASEAASTRGPCSSG